MREEEAIVVLAAMVILAGASLLYAAMVNRRKMREMEHRERLAMIERGVSPYAAAPERAYSEPPSHIPETSGAGRFRTAGIVLIGIGLGLFFIIGFAANAIDVGFGVGGAFAVLGAALIYNYQLLTERQKDPGAFSRTPLSQQDTRRPAAEPPDNIAP